MALVAGTAQHPAVRILGLVAVDASAAELLLRYIGAVADVTSEPRMRPQQRKLGDLEMIVLNRFPLRFGMAAFAACAETSRVRILREMAAVTVLGHLVLIVSGCVAGGTFNVCVGVVERKSGFLRVVELCRFPCAHRMTFAAV